MFSSAINKKSLILYAAYKIRAMKPNSYTKLYVHCIFTPKGRESMLSDSVRDNIHKYIYGVIKGKKCFPVAINGMKDHIHLLIGFNPMISISDLIRDIKRSSAMFINEQSKSYYKFKWQEGFGAFTVGFRDLDRVLNIFQISRSTTRKRVLRKNINKF